MKTRTSPLNAVCCASLLALGCGLAWALIAQVTYEVVIGRPPYLWSSISLDDDCEPYITINEQDPVTLMPEYRNQTLTGDLINQQNAYLNRTKWWQIEIPYSASHPDNGLIPGFTPWSQKVIGIMRQKRGQNEFELWRLMSVDGRRAYLVGHDVRTKQRLGFIAKHGLQNDYPTFDECLELVDEVSRIRSYGIQVTSSDGIYLDGHTSFIGDYASARVYAISGDRELLTIDLDQRSVKSEKLPAPIQSICLVNSQSHWAVDEIVVDSEAMARERQLLVRLPEQLKLHSGNQWYDFTIPSELRSRDFSVIFRDAQRALATVTQELPEIGRSRHGTRLRMNQHDLYWFDPAGQITRREQVKIERSILTPTMSQLAFVMPTSVPHFAHGLLREAVHSGVAVEDIASAGAIALVLGLIGAIACWRRETLFQTPPGQRWLWAAFVLFCGLPGWIGYRFHRSWPLLAACEHCHRRRPMDRIECPSCATPLPCPAPRGIEIFDRATHELVGTK